MAQNPNIAPVHCLEVTIAEFHQRRRHLVESVRFLLEAAEAADSPDSNITYERLSTFVRSEFISGLPVQGGETFGLKIFKAVESLDDEIMKADVSRKNAGSNTTVPSGQGMLFPKITVC
jgi:nuclear pore complex protein Nup205